MAGETRPSSLPVWATTAAAADKSAPDVGKQQSGFGYVGAEPEYPPLQDFNWHMNLTYQWLLWLSDVTIGSNDGPDEILNNQSTPVDLVDGSANQYVFDSSKYGAAIIEGHVRVNADTDRFAILMAYAVWDGSTWSVTQDSLFNPNHGVTLSITAAGVLQYTSGVFAGYVSGQISWRARRFDL